MALMSFRARCVAWVLCRLTNETAHVCSRPHRFVSRHLPAVATASLTVTSHGCCIIVALFHDRDLVAPLLAGHMLYRSVLAPAVDIQTRADFSMCGTFEAELSRSAWFWGCTGLQVAASRCCGTSPISSARISRMPHRRRDAAHTTHSRTSATSMQLWNSLL